MHTCDGLSLTEVLISLLLVTTTSLALIQQQWHISQYTHQIYHRNEGVLQLANAAEQLMAQDHLNVDDSVHLTYGKHHNVLNSSQAQLSLTVAHE